MMKMMVMMMSCSLGAMMIYLEVVFAPSVLIVLRSSFYTIYNNVFAQDVSFYSIDISIIVLYICKIQTTIVFLYRFVKNERQSIFVTKKSSYCMPLL
jgi:hypothetical protein